MDMTTKEAKVAFVRNLSTSIADSLVRAIEDGRIPVELDGHELRVALAEVFTRDATCSAIRHQPRSARARAYRKVMANAGRL